MNKSELKFRVVLAVMNFIGIMAVWGAVTRFVKKLENDIEAELAAYEEELDRPVPETMEEYLMARESAMSRHPAGRMSRKDLGAQALREALEDRDREFREQ